MKCPQCGSEVENGKACGNCGTEIQYKDFKVSELLDIRLGRVSSGQGKKPGPAPEHRVLGHERYSGAERPRLKKTPIWTVTVAILILAAIGGFYLLRYLGWF